MCVLAVELPEEVVPQTPSTRIAGISAPKTVQSKDFGGPKALPFGHLGPSGLCFRNVTPESLKHSDLVLLNLCACTGLVLTVELKRIGIGA